MREDHATILGMLTADEWPEVLELLGRAKLPVGGLERHRETVLVARNNGRLVGCAALELYGTSALLRSVAVEEAQRRQGVGVRLTEAALALAARLGVRRIYLLTETARDFFPRFGFRVVGRDAVEAAVLASEEFRVLCPASATVMMRGE